MDLSALPEGWCSLPEGHETDVTVVAFDASINTAVAFREYGEGAFRPPNGVGEPLDPDGIIQVVHPDDMPSVVDALSRLVTLSDGEKLVVDLRTLDPDGAIRPIHCETTVLTRDPTGRPRMAKVVVTPRPGP